MTTSSVAGRRIILTGAAGGIGRVIAAALAARGARLTLVGRRAEPLIELLAELGGDSSLNRFHAFDCASDHQWIARRSDLCPEGRLDGLVLAAGVLGPIGPLGTWSIDEFRRTIETNLMGTLVPIAVLVDLLAVAAGSVVTFSGGGATSPLRRYDAYAASKAAVVRLTENLAGDLADRGIRINAVAPGFVVTDMHRATMDAGPEAVGRDYFDKTAAAIESGTGDSPAPAADLVSFLLSDSASGITGRLISAQWDPWRDPSFLESLRSTDALATLRRIDDQFFTPIHRD